MFGVVPVAKGRSQPSPRFLLLANALLHFRLFSAGVTVKALIGAFAGRPVIRRTR